MHTLASTVFHGIHGISKSMEYFKNHVVVWVAYGYYTNSMAKRQATRIDRKLPAKHPIGRGALRRRKQRERYDCTREVSQRDANAHAKGKNKRTAAPSLVCTKQHRYKGAHRGDREIMRCRTCFRETFLPQRARICGISYFNLSPLSPLLTLIPKSAFLFRRGRCQ